MEDRDAKVLWDAITALANGTSDALEYKREKDPASRRHLQGDLTPLEALGREVLELLPDGREPETGVAEAQAEAVVDCVDERDLDPVR